MYVYYKKIKQIKINTNELLKKIQVLHGFESTSCCF